MFTHDTTVTFDTVLGFYKYSCRTREGSHVPSTNGHLVICRDTKVPTRERGVGSGEFRPESSSPTSDHGTLRSPWTTGLPQRRLTERVGGKIVRPPLGPRGTSSSTVAQTGVHVLVNVSPTVSDLENRLGSTLCPSFFSVGLGPTGSGIKLNPILFFPCPKDTPIHTGVWSVREHLHTGSHSLRPFLIVPTPLSSHLRKTRSLILLSQVVFAPPHFFSLVLNYGGEVSKRRERSPRPTFIIGDTVKGFPEPRRVTSV